MPAELKLPAPEWWRHAERSDLVLLGRALRGGWVSATRRAAIFAALARRAAEKGGRFARTGS
jgi:hypothetical protein